MNGYWDRREGISIWCRTFGPLTLHADTLHGLALMGLEFRRETERRQRTMFIPTPNLPRMR